MGFAYYYYYFFACLIQVSPIQDTIHGMHFAFISLLYIKSSRTRKIQTYLWFKGVTSYAIYLLHRV